MREIVSPLDGIRSPFGFIRGGVVPFSPLSLFASGEEGAWYEPSTTTAFKSTTDLTPCGYGAEDGVCGFLLDKSQGAGYSGGSFTGLGSELVTNGTFDSDVSGWTANSFKTITWSSGELLLSVASFGAGGAVQTLTTEIGKTYYFSCVARRSAGTNTGVLLQVRSSATWPGSFLAGVETTSATNETISFAYTATSTTTYLWLAGGTDVEGYFDNISVRELPGNHATQGTSSARPILARVPSGGRRNLLPIPTSWDTILDVTISDGVADPDGGTNAYSVQQNSTSTQSLDTSSSYVSGTSYVGNFKIRVISGQWIRFFVAGVGVYLDANNSFAEGTTGTGFVSSFASSLGSGWWEITIVCTAQSTGSLLGGVQVQQADGSAAELLNGEYYLYEAQIEEGSSATAYQRVSSQYDITEAGVTSLDYLAFDGSDDGMATASIDFTATDKMSVFAGVEKEDGSAVEIVLESSSEWSGNNGAMAIYLPNTTSYEVAVRGDAANRRNYATFTSPITNVLSSTISTAAANSAEAVSVRVDGSAVSGTDKASALSTGNFGNYPLYIGSRANTSLFFDGKLFSLIVRGAASTAGEISDTESYVANLSGVTI